MTSKIIIVLLSVAGFALASFIRYKKTAGQKMVCMIGQDCDTVVRSQYSRFLGIPVELLGMVYYAFIAVAYGLAILFPEIFSIQWTFWIASFTAAAFLFSGYLVFIQAVVLKEWCEWCLTSAGLCFAIFFTVFYGIPLGFLEFLRANTLSIAIVDSFSLALGVGSATVTAVLFIRFLKDGRISADENAVLKMISQITWVALGLLLLSGAGTFLPRVPEMLSNPAFLVTLSALAVIIFAEAVLYLWIAPELIDTSLREEREPGEDKLGHTRRLAFGLSAVAIVSWYSFFIFKNMEETALSFELLFFVYISILAASVAAAIFADSRFVRKTA